MNSGPSMEKKIILVVDDEVPILNLMKMRLEMDGYQVVTCPSGKQCIQAVERLTSIQRTRILTILLDIGLQDISGEDVLKQLKNFDPSINIIMVTGLHDEEKARKLVSLGAFDYITKPVDFEILLKTLGAMAAD